MAKLVYTDQGVHHEFVLEFDRDVYTIGRNPMCDLRVNNPSMSRKHAEIRVDREARTFAVADLDSSNGTFVNGRRTDLSPLQNGDVVLCGEFRLVYNGDVPRRSTDSMSGDGAGGPPPIPRTEEVSAITPREAGKRPVPTMRGVAPGGSPAEDVAPSFGEPSRPQSAPAGNEPRQHTQQAIVPTRASDSGAIAASPAPVSQHETERGAARRDGEFEATISALRNENGVLRDEIEQRDRMIVQMRASLDQADPAALEDAYEQIGDLNSRLDDAARRNDALTVRLQEADAGMQRRDGRLAEQDIRIDALEGARDETGLRLAEVQQERDRLRAQKEMMTEAFDDLRSELRRLLEVNEALTSELERARRND